MKRKTGRTPPAAARDRAGSDVQRLLQAQEARIARLEAQVRQLSEHRGNGMVRSYPSDAEIQVICGRRASR